MSDEQDRKFLRKFARDILEGDFFQVESHFSEAFEAFIRIKVRNQVARGSFDIKQEAACAEAEGKAGR